MAKNNGGVVGDLSLSLHADDSLTNYGNISSAGDLTLTAGKSVQNLERIGFDDGGKVDQRNFADDN